MSSVLIIGAGDIGERLAAVLAGQEEGDQLILAGRSRDRVETVAATIASAYECFVETEELDATRVGDVAGLLKSSRPDLVVLCASHRSPWQLLGRDDPTARAVTAAGLAVRLPYQLLIPLAVMRAVADIPYDAPVANLSFPV